MPLFVLGMSIAEPCAALRAVDGRGIVARLIFSRYGLAQALAGSQGANRADARHASRSPGEETAAEADHQSRSSECVPAEGISARTQPAVRPCGGEAGSLSPAGPPSCGTGSDISAGERADHRERLGSALRESLFSAGAAEPRKGCPSFNFNRSHAYT